LAGLPARIEALEAEQAELLALMAAPDFFRRPPAELAVHQARLSALEEKLAVIYRRWEELESKAG
ncbi:ABC transporter ATP-binding protein, partial [Desulfurivibrio sp. C05AmB]